MNCHQPREGEREGLRRVLLPSFIAKFTIHIKPQNEDHRQHAFHSALKGWVGFL